MSNFPQKEKHGGDNLGAGAGNVGGHVKDAGQRVGEAAKEFGNQAGSQIKNAGQKAGDAAKKTTDEVQSFAASAAQGAQDMAQKATDEAKHFAGTAMHKAEDAASFIGQKAGDASKSLGTGMESLGGSIRHSGPKDGMLASASSAVADSLETGGRYLEEHGLSDIGADLTGVIRSNPIPSVLIAVGIGFLLARATRS